MIEVYRRRNGTIEHEALGSGAALPDDAIWVDIREPEEDEARAVEEALGFKLPNRAVMEEIEVSSRLYQEGSASYMTATVIARSESDRPQSVPITFVLVGKKLVTVRYADPLPFRQFAGQVERLNHIFTGEDVLAGLLDAIVDRIADILESVQQELDKLSARIFAKDRARGDVDFNDVLRIVGQAQGLTMRTNESLLTIGRVLTFVSRPGETKLDKTTARLFKTVSRDVSSLSDHASYLSNNITFLLDATLGMINIEQTGIIKIFSVAAVVFLPPTLIASIYGMNFKFMPELDWLAGYPLSLVLMVVSSILPYLYFKRRGWL